jgi:lysophospholipase L1-like esterase
MPSRPGTGERPFGKTTGANDQEFGTGIAGCRCDGIIPVICPFGGRRVMPGPHLLAAAALAISVAVPAAPPANAVAASAGLNYVAMGSSFAAGPGIPPAQPGSGATACSRSGGNYPSVVARDIGAVLTDASCSGATTANVLTDGQSGQPPQISAVTGATQVVTVTIGGNDVNYLGSLGAYTCQNDGGSGCASVDRAAIDRTFSQLAGRIQNVVNAVRGTAPGARVYLVNYFTILPTSGTCAGVPLTTDQLAYERSIAARLEQATSAAATATNATLVDLAAASRGHDACSTDPWVETGHPPAGRSSYHPNEAGMRAAAALVETALASAGQLRTAHPAGKEKRSIPRPSHRE